jgi:hypothetical protein
LEWPFGRRWVGGGTHAAPWVAALLLPAEGWGRGCWQVDPQQRSYSASPLPVPLTFFDHPH